MNFYAHHSKNRRGSLSPQGWHRHVTMVMLGYASLALETLRSKKNSEWTLPRARREIQYLLFTWTGACAYCGQEIHLREP